MIFHRVTLFFLLCYDLEDKAIDNSFHHAFGDISIHPTVHQVRETIGISSISKKETGNKESVIHYSPSRKMLNSTLHKSNYNFTESSPKQYTKPIPSSHPSQLPNFTSSPSSNLEHTSSPSKSSSQSPNLTSSPSPQSPNLTSSHPTQSPNLTSSHLTQSPNLTSSHLTQSNLTSSPSKSSNQSTRPFKWEKYIFHYRVSPNHHTPHLYLFIVNFHWVNYRQVPFIRDTYFPKFLSYFQSDFDVVIVGPKTNEERLVIGNGLPQGGYYSYYGMPYIYHLLCEQRSCNYDGFLFMNDDSYIDPQFLKSYNLSMSWSEPSVVCNPRRNGRWRWPFNKNNVGIPFYIAYENAIKTLQREEVGKLCNFKNVDNNRRGYSDAFYLARKDVKVFNRIATVMFENSVFLEMATPSAMWCVTHSFFNDCNHGRMKNRETCVHMHHFNNVRLLLGTILVTCSIKRG